MKTKFTFFRTASVLLLLLILSSCSQKNETYKTENADFNMRIIRLSKLMCSVGDTIEIYGHNFGSERKLKVVVFNETEVADNGYLKWNDSIIRVVIPKGAGIIEESSLVSLNLAKNGMLYINNRESNSLSYEVLRPWYINIIEYFIEVSLLITLIFTYLKINKMWKRKHEKEVADSQSLIGLSIYVANCVLWVLYYVFLNYDQKSIADTSVYIFEGSIYFMIGTGIFVRGQRGLGIWLLIKQALRLERKEADYLLKKWFRPANAEVIIGILHQIAMIDEEFDPKEEELIRSFAKEWNIEYNVEKLNLERHKDKENSYIRLRKSVERYLDREPPLEQVAQLKDMITTMIQADEKVTYEEEMISAELLPMIENYLRGDENAVQYLVMIVPQRPEQESSIMELLPHAKKIFTSGGIAYMIDSFYSRKFAEMVCNQYREYNFFTIVNTPETAQI
jgi:hypothetical protein